MEGGQPIAVPESRYFEPEIETMPRPELMALQEARLLELIPYAYERSDFVRSTWQAAGVHPRDVKSLHDYVERAPTMDKTMIRAFREEHDDPFGGLRCVSDTELKGVWSSSGTSGDPTLIPDTWDTWSTLGRSLCRDLWEWGLRPGDHAIQGSGARGPFMHCVQMLGAVPLVLPYIQADWREVFKLMAQYRPVWVHTGYPTLSKWEELSREYDLEEVFAPFKFFTFGGDHLGRLWRERVEGWVPAVHEWTSAGDCGFAAQCREHDGFHIWEDNVLAEGLDPDGTQPFPDGELVELTTTGLDQRAGPLVRFRTEDLVRITREPCACGRTHARFWFLGRKGDQLHVQGRPVFTRDFYEVIEAIPETRAGIFQLIREAKEMDVLKLRVGYQPALTGDVADLGEHIRAAVEDRLGLVADLDLVPEEQILASSMSYKVTRVVKQ